MKSPLPQVLQWLRSLFGKSPRGEGDSWTEAYASLILAQGASTPAANIAKAKRLGLDVDELIREHDRREAASWTVEFLADLAICLPGTAAVDEQLRASGVPERVVETRGATLAVYLAELYARVDLPRQNMRLTDMVILAIQAIHKRFIDCPDEFPSNQYPFQYRDFLLTSLRWSEAEQRWYANGRRKIEALERIPSKLDPSHSIDLLRAPYHPRPLVSSRPFPELFNVTLSVWKWPDGKHVVMGAYESEVDAPEVHKAVHDEQPDTLRLSYPSEKIPVVSWDGNVFSFRTPATHFLEQHEGRTMGRPADWLRPFTVEAVFVNGPRIDPAVDLRASLMSGAKGPAPLPVDMEWPCCPTCGELALFSQSLDMRDAPFARLLPGSTLVIFVCNSCLEHGEWRNCSALAWLPENSPVVLKDCGERAPLYQCTQWCGPDNDHDKIDAPTRELLASPGPPPWLPASYGTKVGGVPFYLQSETTFYDRNGVAMEYIAQIGTPEYIKTNGFGYISFSTKTGETYLEFQDT